MLLVICIYIGVAIERLVVLFFFGQTGPGHYKSALKLKTLNEKLELCRGERAKKIGDLYYAVEFAVAIELYILMDSNLF